LNGGVPRAELNVVERIVSLGAEFENPLLVQADILGAVTGASNLRINEAIRGETPDDFLETRNAPGAFYSVTAKPKAG
jgi:gallate dioxygenase